MKNQNICRYLLLKTAESSRQSDQIECLGVLRGLDLIHFLPPPKRPNSIAFVWSPKICWNSWPALLGKQKEGMQGSNYD